MLEFNLFIKQTDLKRVFKKPNSSSLVHLSHLIEGRIWEEKNIKETANVVCHGSLTFTII